MRPPDCWAPAGEAAARPQAIAKSQTKQDRITAALSRETSRAVEDTGDGTG
jgi:hypothetical protein